MNARNDEYVLDMTTLPHPRIFLLALVVSALALAGCGSGQTKTVSVSSAPVQATTSTQSTTTKQTTPTTSTPAHGSTSPNTSENGGTEATRTSTAPAFTKQAAASGEGLGAAVAAVKAHGYTPNDTSDYHPDQTLRVLVGTRTGSGDGYGQQAFFFVDGRYIGTDSTEASATVKVVGQSDTEVTLAYPLYKAHDPLCCPGGGQATIHFQLNNGHLVPLSPIPPTTSQAGLSRQ